MSITKNKDLDIKIVYLLNDKDLVNKYFNQLEK